MKGLQNILLHPVHSMNIFFVRGRRAGLPQMDGRRSVSEQGQAGRENSPHHWSQHWYWERDSPGHGPERCVCLFVKEKYRKTKTYAKAVSHVLYMGVGHLLHNELPEDFL